MTRINLPSGGFVDVASSLRGSGPPAASLGDIGDLYTDTTAQQLYSKIDSNTWEVLLPSSLPALDALDERVTALEPPPGLY